MGRSIRPSGDGFVYLTDALYRFGWQATDRLALPTNYAEVAVPILATELRDRDVEYRGLVKYWPYGVGQRFRRGGGHQWIVKGSIVLSIMPWSWILLEVP